MQLIYYDNEVIAVFRTDLVLIFTWDGITAAVAMINCVAPDEVIVKVDITVVKLIAFWYSSSQLTLRLHLQLLLVKLLHLKVLMIGHTPLNG